jgi:hypothetical protein
MCSFGGSRYDDYHKLLPGIFWHGRLVTFQEIKWLSKPQKRQYLIKTGSWGNGIQPNPAEPLLAFDAQIKEIQPTADDKNICLGLQFIGLEANLASQALQKLYNPEGTYYEAKKNTTI